MRLCGAAVATGLVLSGGRALWQAERINALMSMGSSLWVMAFGSGGDFCNRR